ncbi:hypothetical protein LINPERPRIM_LOCUS26831 [Linum perenne]
MADFAIIAAVLLSLFVAYLAFLFLQFLYVICRRKSLADRRRTCPLPTTTKDDTGSTSPTQIKDFLRSSWKNKTTSLSSKAVAAAAEAATAVDSSTVVVVPPTDEEVEEMLTGMYSGMRGPPRFLFTIKEDEREGCADDTAYEEAGGGVSVRFMDILGVVEAEEVSPPSTPSRQCTLSSLLKDEVNGGCGGGVGLSRVVVAP